jgi:hypothetical protein
MYIHIMDTNFTAFFDNSFANYKYLKTLHLGGIQTRDLRFCSTTQRRQGIHDYDLPRKFFLVRFQNNLGGGQRLYTYFPF